MKKTNKKNHVIVALLVLLLALAIGYAAFSTTLTIDGTATGSADWDVHFLSARLVQSDKSTVDTDHGSTAPSINAAGDTITASVDLAYPGDGVLLEAVVENGGELAARLDSFTVTGTDTDFEVSAPTMATGESGEVIDPDGTCTVYFLVRWKPTSEVTDLGTKTFTITYTYGQDTTDFTGTTGHSDA